MLVFVAHTNVNLPRELEVVSMLETAAWCKDKEGAIYFSGIQSGKEKVISQAKRPALGCSVGRTSAITSCRKHLLLLLEC